MCEITLSNGKKGKHNALYLDDNACEVAVTDLEIVRLCAEAMGLEPLAVYGMDVVIGATPNRYVFRPLHDDGQAMALLYWLSFECEIIVSSGEFHCNSEEHKMEEIYGITSNADLNRAICECVAKMQAAK